MDIYNVTVQRPGNVPDSALAANTTKTGYQAGAPLGFPDVVILTTSPYRLRAVDMTHSFSYYVSCLYTSSSMGMLKGMKG